LTELKGLGETDENISLWIGKSISDCQIRLAEIQKSTSFSKEYYPLWGNDYRWSENKDMEFNPQSELYIMRLQGKPWVFISDAFHMPFPLCIRQWETWVQNRIQSEKEKFDELRIEREISDDSENDLFSNNTERLESRNRNATYLAENYHPNTATTNHSGNSRLKRKLLQVHGSNALVKRNKGESSSQQLNAPYLPQIQTPTQLYKENSSDSSSKSVLSTTCTPQQRMRVVLEAYYNRGG